MNNPWGLTTREEEVLLVLATMHRKRAASSLGIGIKTIDQHLLNARRKMDTPTTLTTLVAYDRWRNSSARCAEQADRRAKAEAIERERIAAWLDQDWTADAVEERAHRKFIAAKLRQHVA